MCIQRCIFAEGRLQTKNERRSIQSWMRKKKQTENSPSVGKHGTAKPQTGNSAKSKRVTAVSFSKWERECKMCCFYQRHVSEFEHRLPQLPSFLSLGLQDAHTVAIQIPTTHLIFPQCVLCDLFRSH